MEINVFMPCFNECVLLPHTIHHYKKNLPSCRITIYDNGSTDGSVEIAKSFGCDVRHWDTGGHTDEFKLKDLKNTCWKDVTSGWIIMVDMDEWLSVTEKDLMDEMEQGTTMLNTLGLDMIGESDTLDLSDIQLSDIHKYHFDEWMSKKACFLRNAIEEMNYNYGAHDLEPKGRIQMSLKTYHLKHMSSLGLKFITQRIQVRYERSHHMRALGMDYHYSDDIEKIRKDYMEKLATCQSLS